MVNKAPVSPSHRARRLMIVMNLGVNQDGTKLQIWECNAGNPNQQFNVSASAFIWNKTNKCLDLTNGNIQDGNQVSSFRGKVVKEDSPTHQMQVWTCGSSNANQKWIGAGPSFSTKCVASTGNCVTHSDSHNLVMRSSHQHQLVSSSPFLWWYCR
jgi:hypothetical protein